MNNLLDYSILTVIILLQFDYLLTDLCSDNIHRNCLHTETYSAAEITVAEKYIINAFSKSVTGTKPNGEVCKSFRIRKDFKCLNKTELDAFVDVFKKLIANGFTTNLTKIHDKYWAQSHKTSEAKPFHRWVMLLFELAARQLPGHENFTLPYWDFYLEAYQPEKSIIWDTCGRPGPDGCIADGPFANLQVYYPEQHCLRRFWNTTNSSAPTIDNWEPAEWTTSYMQMGANPVLLAPYLTLTKNLASQPINLLGVPRLAAATAQIALDPTVAPYAQYSIMRAYTNHFVTHLVLGGLLNGTSGDLSTGYGTQDPAFYLFHNGIDYDNQRRQLSRVELRVPTNSYAFGVRLDYMNRSLIPDLENDVLTYFNVSLKDTFTFGYGDLCYTFDRFIKPINDIINNQPIPFPPAVHRLKSALGDDFPIYYPRFASGAATYFDHVFPDVGDCNTGHNCNLLKRWQYYTDTENGRINAWDRFKNDANLDITPIVAAAEKYDHKFRDILNSKGYCSPFALP